MVRACGSYPQSRGFKSLLRYHNSFEITELFNREPKSIIASFHHSFHPYAIQVFIYVLPSADTNDQDNERIIIEGVYYTIIP